MRIFFFHQRENQQKLRQIGQELSNVNASANRLKSLEEELQRAVCIKLSISLLIGISISDT